MNVSAPHIALVHDTLPRITARIGQASMAFEAHLARYAPSMTGGLAAGRGATSDALVQTLCAGLSGALPAEIAQARLAGLAHGLRDAGLGPRGYIAIHAALMDMVIEHVSDIDGAEEAWADVIGTVLASMVSEAHGSRRTVMPLAA